MSGPSFSHHWKARIFLLTYIVWDQWFSRLDGINVKATLLWSETFFMCLSMGKQKKRWTLSAIAKCKPLKHTVLLLAKSVHLLFNGWASCYPPASKLLQRNWASHSCDLAVKISIGRFVNKMFNSTTITHTTVRKMFRMSA